MIGSVSRRAVAGIGLLAWMLAGAGCATQPGPDWDQRIGTYTVDQAVAGLGRPHQSWELEDGTRVLEWVDERTVPQSAGYAGRVGNPVRRPESAFSEYRSTTQYRVLTLTFGGDGRLLYWTRSGPR